MTLRSLEGAVVLIALTVAPASAQVVVNAPDSSQVAPVSVMEQSVLDTPIQKLAESPGACAVLDHDLAGLRDHPMYSAFKSMSLNQIAAMSGGKITPQMLAQTQVDLAALPATKVAAVSPPPTATP